MHLRALLARRSMSRLFSLFEPSRANCFKSTRTGFKLRFFLVIAEFSSTVSFQILCFKFIVAGMSRRSLLTCLVVLMAVTCEELRKFALQTTRLESLFISFSSRLPPRVQEKRSESQRVRLQLGQQSQALSGDRHSAIRYSVARAHRSRGFDCRRQ